MGQIWSLLRPHKQDAGDAIWRIECLFPLTARQYQMLSHFGMIQQDVYSLYTCFCRIDRQDRNEINLIQFLDYSGILWSHFAKRVFRVLDTDSNGSVSFAEYLIDIWVFGSFNRVNLCRYIFDLYDRDLDGVILPSDVKLLVAELWGRDWGRNPVARQATLCFTATFGNDEGIPLNAFLQFVSENPTLLLPAFQMQSQLREKIAGPAFWNGVNKRRSNQCRPAEIVLSADELHQTFAPDIETEHPEAVLQSAQRRQSSYDRAHHRYLAMACTLKREAEAAKADKSGADSSQFYLSWHTDRHLIFSTCRAPMGNVLRMIDDYKQRQIVEQYKISDEQREVFRQIGLRVSDLNQLYELFCEMDEDGSGEISVEEFLVYFAMETNQFSKKAFKVMDTDGSGEVSFPEFVLAIWNYCSFTQSSLAAYAFGLYDDDGSGEIDELEMEQLVMEVWGSSWERNAQAQKVLAKLRLLARENGGVLLEDVWQEFSKRHPVLMFPAFQMQRDMQTKIIGLKFWEKAEQRRRGEEMSWDELHKMFTECDIDALKDASVPVADLEEEPIVVEKKEEKKKKKKKKKEPTDIVTKHADEASGKKKKTKHTQAVHAT